MTSDPLFALEMACSWVAQLRARLGLDPYDFDMADPLPEWARLLDVVGDLHRSQVVPA